MLSRLEFGATLNHAKLSLAGALLALLAHGTRGKTAMDAGDVRKSKESAWPVQQGGHHCASCPSKQHESISCPTEDTHRILIVVTMIIGVTEELSYSESEACTVASALLAAACKLLLSRQTSASPACEVYPAKALRLTSSSNNITMKLASAGP